MQSKRTIGRLMVSVILSGTIVLGVAGLGLAKDTAHKF